MNVTSLMKISVSGAAITGRDSFRRRRDVLSTELVAGDFSADIALFTFSSLMGAMANGDCKVLSALMSDACDMLLVGELTPQMMLLTEDMKKLLITLAEILEIVGV